MSQRFSTTVTGRSLGDHVCWTFHGTQEYIEGAREYVVEGLDSHQLVTFVKVAPDRLEHTVVSDVAQVGLRAEDGRPVPNQLAVRSGWTAASTTVPAQIARMTRSAVANGYAGLRLLTDVNDLVRRPEGRREWIRAEHLIDRYALDNPLTALCGYDVDDLGVAVVAEAARMHPLTCGALSPFLLRATDAEGGLALIGEVDIASADDLCHALMSIGPDIPAHVTVNMSELEFIDHTGLVALDRAARALGVTMTLRYADPLTAWLIDTLELSNVEAGRGP